MGVTRRTPENPDRDGESWGQAVLMWTSVGGNVQLGLLCGRSWGSVPPADRGGGAPPTPPPRSALHLRPLARDARDEHVAFRGTFDYTPRREEPAHRAGQVPGCALRRRRARQGHRAVRRDLAARRPTTPTRSARSGDCTRSRPRRSKLKRFFAANSHDTELDSAGPRHAPELPARARAACGKEVVVTGAGDRLEVWDRGRWAELQRRPRRRRREHHRRPGPCWLR